MSHSLVIVESPSKAKTIKKYLGNDYTVKASVGHIRDLPASTLGVDIENGFKPKYITIKGKEKIIADLKEAAKKADAIFLAPDPDREGEAIAWHIANSIKAGKKPVMRVLFNEITRAGIKDGLNNPRPLDENLFASQQTRRILDRLVGYKLSPLLWKKVKRGLSAGRVQSVAMRLVVDRESEIDAFVPVEYWDIFADVEAENPPVFRIKLAKENDKKAIVGNKEQADKVIEALNTNPMTVSGIKKKPVKRAPYPPFITSTLQQAASSQMKMAPKRTMRIAQQLYEGIQIGDEPVGLITYMRTDSVRIAGEAQNACREYIRETFGEQFLPDKPNFYKSRKSAQDAHEAIRPTSLEYEPNKIKSHLTNEQFRIYRIIWNRFVASQMTHALSDQTTVEVSCGRFILTATNTVEVFAGHLQVSRNDDDDKDGPADKLPVLSENDMLKLIKLDPQQKFTQPPTRFSESALIREMEEKGIGRPSTYASIISVIQDKEYVVKKTLLLHPTGLGRVVTKLLVESFPDVLDISFTAQMEEDLDLIEEGKSNPEQLLDKFWNEFSKQLETAFVEMKNLKIEGEETDIICDKCGKPMGIKYGKNGSFLACSDFPTCRNIKNFERKEDGTLEIIEDTISDEKCEKCGEPMIIKRGRWGPFLACSGYPACKNIVSLKKNGEKSDQPKAEPDPNVPCPTCESPMVQRTSRFGNRFYSCSKYPKCKGTKPFETDVPCPTEGCDGHLVERLTRKKPMRPFWGCSKYPDCEFTTFEEPVNTPCPNCGNKIMTKSAKNETVHCQSCEFVAEKPVVDEKPMVDEKPVAQAEAE